ncbi:MAG: GAF domain-containing protein, partial [Polyangiales bacterium]
MSDRDAPTTHRPAPPLHTPPPGARVHARGDARLDAVVDFVEFAIRSLALSTLLDEAPARIASILASPVCSLYIVEHAIDDEGALVVNKRHSLREVGTELGAETSSDPAQADAELVMRGNVGFPAMALGDVRLKVGEGLTGSAVAHGRPISVDQAAVQSSYRYFSQLGEERYPVFLCAPIVGPEGPLGAVTVQREEGRRFEDRDVELLVALAATLAHGLLRAELIDQLHGQPVVRGPGGGTRRVTLPGRPVVPGRAVGAIAALRRPASRPRDAGDGQAATLLRGAFETAAKAITSIEKRAVGLGLAEEASYLATYAQILDDSRFLERAVKSVEAKRSIGGGMAEVAREATRAARVTGDEFSERRARDLEDLCDAITMLCSADPRAELPTRAVLIGDRLTVYDQAKTAQTYSIVFGVGGGLALGAGAAVFALSFMKSDSNNR